MASPEECSRVAIVTGAARGIGAATVRGLVAAGWRVVAVDRCADDPRIGYPLATRAELAALAAEHPESVVDLAVDVTDLSALRDAVEVAVYRFGGLDAAVAAASVIAGGRPLWEITDGEWAALFDVGVTGVANLARAAVPVMLRREQPRSGRFVALASAAAHRGLWHLAAYGAAKHAVVGLVKGLANDLRGTGVTATAVSPGSTRTDMLAATAGLYHLESVEAFGQHQIVGRVLEPSEVAAVVCWLCSAESAAITGSVVHADGGFTG
ncbi:mycofactocin-coupled SDR family oxidoreductase [Actinokineospora sp.]|uniref:mycofactocin-coupled SDR family oxidoreductase n=1 Tax=Actinokineospora sp. TaxID=1872133 RepID=UPI003D6BC52E